MEQSIVDGRVVEMEFTKGETDNDADNLYVSVIKDNKIIRLCISGRIHYSVFCEEE